MKRSQFSEEQTFGILRKAQGGSAVKTVCAADNKGTAMLSRWRRCLAIIQSNPFRGRFKLRVRARRCPRSASNSISFDGWFSGGYYLQLFL